MNKFFFILLILLSSRAFGQSEKPFVISDSIVSDRWVSLSDNWRYHKGDNLAWANPEFNDSGWKKLSANNLNMPEGKKSIADRGEIAWFRNRIMADSALTEAIVLNIEQLGASEIYLDGKLINQLGRVSTDPDSVVYVNPSRELLQLPLIKGKEQVLAIRYVNAQYKFPIYNGKNGYIDIGVTSLTNSNSHNISKNFRIASRSKFYNNFLVTLGISIMIFVIFLSLFLFFAKEKINGYFALSAFFTVFSVSVILAANTTSGDIFWYSFIYAVGNFISMILVFYCIYLLLGHKIDFIFILLFGFTILVTGLFFLFSSDTIAPLVVILYYIATIKISIQSWNKNRKGAFIFIVSSSIGLLYWMLLITLQFLHIPNDISQFVPISFMLQPVTLAIYLGYAFGKKSQDLSLNLEQVQKLSRDKEEILSKQNETLEQQVQERTNSLNKSLVNLRSTQAQLIQSAKMASLGELTAGIAHEIQNPLNFVNNFSDVNKELISEMKTELAIGNSQFAIELADDIEANEEKINHHGKRADAIVKGMLQHSQSSTGKKEPTDINALCDEYLRLSYHGLRAKDKSFNATMKTDFDNSIEKINIIPQDIGRVILNLINNAFYAVAPPPPKGGLQSPRINREPTVIVKTLLIPPSGGGGAKVVISVTDNGNGIPKNIVDKIFQPFFTTKPTGQGTGLGLSLSYDIVKAHLGEIKVETKEGEGTKFIIQLPLNN